MDDIGTDLSKVRIGKAEAIILQQVGKASKTKQTITNGFKRALHIGSDRSSEQKSEEKKKEAEKKVGDGETPQDDGDDEEDSADKDENEKPGPGKVDEFKRAVFYGHKKEIQSQQNGGD